MRYKSKKVTIDGITFDSETEGKRYRNLKLLERGKLILDLKLQPVFPLVIDGRPVLIKSGRYKNGRKCKYTADFTYWDVEKKKQIVEEVKGYPTDVYKLRKAVVEAIYGIDILET